MLMCLSNHVSILRHGFPTGYRFLRTGTRYRFLRIGTLTKYKTKK